MISEGKKNKTKKSYKTYSFRLDKKHDFREIVFLDKIKDKNQFLRDAVDKAIIDEMMKDTSFSME